jgi:hypothetical protein
MTEYHCEVGGKINFVEDLESGTSESPTFSLEFSGVFGLFSQDFFSLGFGFSAGLGAGSSFGFAPRFFLEGPLCRSFKNAETSAVRAGCSGRAEDEKQSSR